MTNEKALARMKDIAVEVADSVQAILPDAVPETMQWARDDDEANKNREFSLFRLYARETGLGLHALATIRVKQSYRLGSPVEILVTEGRSYGGSQYYWKRKDGTFNTQAAVERAIILATRKLHKLEAKREDIQLAKVRKGEIEKAVGHTSETRWTVGTAEFRLRSESGGQIRIMMDPNKDYDAVRIVVSGDGITPEALAAMIKGLEASGWKVV